MLRLIVNADDFGLTEAVNKGVVKSFTTGILTSTSIMANGKAFEHAVKIAHENPDLDIGIHLTLIEEEPVIKRELIQSLVLENGFFYKNAVDFTKRYFSGGISINEVKIELTAQIEKVLDYGIKLTHIDSHQHIHMLPKILDVTLELSKKYNIPFIRLPKESFSKRMFRNLNNLPRLMEMTALNFVCSLGQNKIHRKTDHFVGFFRGGKLNKENLISLINHLPEDGICELMCHPGMEDKENPYSHWGYHSHEEMLALSDKEVKNLINNEKISLTSFNKLIKNKKPLLIN